LNERINIFKTKINILKKQTNVLILEKYLKYLLIILNIYSYFRKIATLFISTSAYPYFFLELFKINNFYYLVGYLWNLFVYWCYFIILC